MSTTQTPTPVALVIGEALVDVVRSPDGAVSEHPGGSPANVALGLARLGRPVQLVTWLGQDAYGSLIRRHLAASGVTVLDGTDSAVSTSIAEATIDAHGGASYTFDLAWQLPRGLDLPSAPAVTHTGSLGAVLQPGASQVKEILTRSRATSTITYDPNLRPALMPPADRTRPIVRELVSLADVVKVSKEDLTWLEPGRPPLDVAVSWAHSGPALVVVTLGSHGAVAVTATGLKATVGASDIVVADTVGAGDSFMAGLIDGLWRFDLVGASRRQALHDVDAVTLGTVLTRCARIADITVSRPGANPPTLAELGEQVAAAES